MLTPEQQLVTAYDLSREYDHRRWSVVLHGTQHDTVQLSETSRYMSYHASLDPDSLTVLLAVNNSICYDTARRTLPVVVTTLYAPNVFTPDAADINSRFIIIGADILQAELTIYNRQGIFVYTTDDIEQGWDGTSNGSPCPQGAYVWHLRYRNASKPNQWHSAIGTVTLLR